MKLCGAYILCLTSFATAAYGQVVLQDGDFSSTTEAWVNASTAAVLPTDDRRTGARGFGFGEGGVRELALYTLSSDITAGARVLITSSPDDTLRLDEATALLQGAWGRFELGRRQGLPDVLLGYSPNPYSFTTAEFGPKSGTTLDPNGGLPLQYLAPDLRNRIGNLSYLGYSTALSDDRSAKLVYVSPRLDGFTIALAYAPDTSTALAGRSRNFDNLLQTAVTYQIYDGQDTYAIGTSYSFAGGNARVNDLHSINGGISAELGDRFMPGSTTILGIDVSSDGDTGLAKGDYHSKAIGVTSSANYEIGPWIFGGYYQVAKAQGDVTQKGNDWLHVSEIGASYRLSKTLRLYNAAYFYDVNDHGAANTSASGTVLLFGVRATL